MLLALAMGRTLGELGEQMTGEEFGYWSALYRSDPWGEQRADLRAGIVAATVANYAGKMRGERSEPARPSDYMPYLERTEDVNLDPDPIAFFGAISG